jgi:Fe-S cluster assembly scaffold protein SufB
VARTRTDLITALYESLGETCFTSDDVAHVEVHGSEVVGLHLVPGLEVGAESRDGILFVTVDVASGRRIEHPVRFCFGLLAETGEQRISLEARIGAGARMAALASCTFPNAIDVLHTMDAEIRLEGGAEYHYLERHVHGDRGGVTVVPRAKVILEENARFRTDFELLGGAAGRIDIDYDAACGPGSVLEMSARVSGMGRDVIKIHERALLAGEGARGVLTTKIAARDRARAIVKNTMTAAAAHARGHVDCKEIVQGDAVAEAIPAVEVRHPKAHVTHEAAIGSVDAKQLETLMARGLGEEAATKLIIEGLLSPRY